MRRLCSLHRLFGQAWLPSLMRSSRPERSGSWAAAKALRRQPVHVLKNSPVEVRGARFGNTGETLPLFQNGRCHPAGHSRIEHAGPGRYNRAPCAIGREKIVREPIHWYQQWILLLLPPWQDRQNQQQLQIHACGCHRRAAFAVSPFRLTRLFFSPYSLINQPAEQSGGPLQIPLL